MYDPLIIILISVVIVQNGLLLTRKRILNRGERQILVDTSVLIDGRILEIATARFIPGRLLIPRSVLGELQLLADGSDHDKRLRARNGLELITKLQGVPRLSVDIYQDAAQAREGVDERLLALASKNGFEICTVDYNLQKVADAQGIKTLSINELSRNLKALYLPGERFELALSQKGQEKNQAIGYASDGTMVVVDGADGRIGQTVSVEIIRSLQTNSGKMMFAKLVNKDANGQTGRGRRDGQAGAKPERPARTGRMFRRPRINEPVTDNGEPVVAKQSRQPERSSQRSANARGGQNGQPRSEEPQAQARPDGRGRRGRKTPEDDLLNLVNKQ